MSRHHVIGYSCCSTDDEIRFLVGRTRSDPSVFASGSSTFTSGQYSDGSCPVTPDSMTSGLGMFNGDLGFCADSDILSYEVDPHLGCSFDDDVTWFRSSLLDDLGLDLDPNEPEIEANQSFLRDPSWAFPGDVASVETGSDVDVTGNDYRRSVLPVSNDFTTGDEFSDNGRQQRLISLATSANDEAVAKRRSRLPGSRSYHSNAGQNGTSHQSNNKRTTNQRTGDVIDDVTSVPTSGVDVTDRSHVLADHRYSSSSLTCVPPNKILRISPDPAKTKASILATLLLTKEPLRANAGSDVLLAQDGPRGTQASRRHPSLLSSQCVLGNLTEVRKKEEEEELSADVFQATSSMCRTERTSGSSFPRSFEEFNLDGDCFVGHSDDLQWTPSQMSSFEVDDKLFAQQQVEPNDLWMHLDDLL